MKPNLSSYEAAARYVAGIGLLILANHGWRCGWFGAAALATASTGFCPFCWMLGITPEEESGDEAEAPTPAPSRGERSREN
ncbi:MAG TPA: DUF2892 domain-containing protein [Lacunisphaera sp.]|nr:DUF2892 domain-containing protein [Lacunisphaera sp.]